MILVKLKLIQWTSIKERKEKSSQINEYAF